MSCFGSTFSRLMNRGRRLRKGRIPDRKNVLWNGTSMPWSGTAATPRARVTGGCFEAAVAALARIRGRRDEEGDSWRRFVTEIRVSRARSWGGLLVEDEGKAL